VAGSLMGIGGAQVQLFECIGPAVYLLGCARWLWCGVSAASSSCVADVEGCCSCVFCPVVLSAVGHSCCRESGD
jgi:hypothetical protein